MQQHAIPQNVMSVEFQLVGNLTLRQFAYIAIGGLFVFLFFSLPLPDWLKWPLILVIGAFSLSLAYLPINDMTLDRWVVAFFRAINSPTKRIWRKEVKELAVLVQDFTRPFRITATPTADRTKLERYLASLRETEPSSDLDLAERTYLESLPFEEAGPPPARPMPPQIVPASLTEEILPPIQERRVIEEDLTKPAPLSPLQAKPVITVHMPNKNIYVKKVSTTTVNRQLHSLASLEGTIVLPVRGERTFAPSEELLQTLAPENAPVVVPPPPPPPAAPAEPVVYQAEPLIPKLDRTEVIPTAVPAAPEKIPGATIEEISEIEQKLAQEVEETRAKLVAKKPSELSPPKPTEKPLPAKATPPKERETAPRSAPVKTTGALPPAPVPAPSKKEPPRPPPPVAEKTPPVSSAIPAVGKMAPPAANVPNVIVGLVKSAESLLLTEVVIIVKDPEGEPVRALKTNKIGQFAISTPLPNGSYTIDLEKDGYTFDTIAVNLNGEIFQPIEIRAR